MQDHILDELFRGSSVDPRLKWFCEPPAWSVDARRGCLVVRPAAGTDFWQKTHYGFEADNGHFLHLPAGGDWVLTTLVRSIPRHQYDQAGLMVRLSSGCWLKTSVEHEPEGPSRLGAVVTNRGYSDWSTQDYTSVAPEVWLRVHREGGDYRVEASADGRAWSQLRVCRLLDDTGGAAVACGLYACSPRGEGFAAEFSLLRLERRAGR